MKAHHSDRQSRSEPPGNDGDSILKAIDIGKRYGYSFCDSMIIGAALEGRADVLLSEDLKHGQAVGSLKIVNHFLEQRVY